MSTGSAEPKLEMVEVLLEGARRMLDDEERRGESLNTRGAAVSGPPPDVVPVEPDVYPSPFIEPSSTTSR